MSFDERDVQLDKRLKRFTPMGVYDGIINEQAARIYHENMNRPPRLSWARRIVNRIMRVFA